MKEGVCNVPCCYGGGSAEGVEVNGLIGIYYFACMNWIMIDEQF